MTYRKIIAILVVLAFAVQTPCFALAVKKVSTDTVRYVPSEWDKEPLYIDRAFGKMTYGFWNFFIGPFELVKEPYESAVLGDNVVVGLGRGILYGVLDVAGGFINFFTFPVTALKIPLPNGGVDF